MKLLLCQKCYKIVGCENSKGKQILCESCDKRIATPCKVYIKCREINKDIICFPCYDEFIAKQN